MDAKEIINQLKTDSQLRKELAELVVQEIENDSSLKGKIVDMVSSEIAEKNRRRTY
jgi:hypothetical protein